MVATCTHHDEMVKADGEKMGRTEFWTIIVPLCALILGLVSIVWASSASNEKVDLISKGAEDRAQRMETLFKSEMRRLDDGQNKRFDKIEAFLRGGVTDARYR